MKKKEKKSNGNLKIKWKCFSNVAFDPYVLIFFGLTVGSVILSVIFKDEIKFSTLLTVISSILGGVFGGYFLHEYNKMSEGGVLKKKGKSAIRNLEMINIQLKTLEKLVAEFVKNSEDEKKNRDLEEVNRHISTTKLNIISSIEDWEDVVPGLKKYLEDKRLINKEYSKREKSMFLELLKSREELIKSENEEKNKEIKERIEELEDQIREVQKERSSLNSNLNVANMSAFINDEPITLGGNSNYFDLNKKVCVECGKEFDSYEPHSSGNIHIMDDSSEKCPDCRYKVNLSDGK